MSINSLKVLLLSLLFFSLHFASAQTNILIDLNKLETQTLGKQNALDFSITNNGASFDGMINGIISFRQSNQSIKYSMHTNIKSGVNDVSRFTFPSNANYSNTAIKEVFESGVLPAGEYSYCVTVGKFAGGEVDPNGIADNCIYNTNEDLFLINLVDPNDKAKLTEQYPMLSWMSNSRLNGQLNYKIKVAELKEGQNKQNAIKRNNAVFEESGLSATSIVYPTSAKELEKYQPYVWTVDAYYKNLLMGSAETWQFVIIDDSLFNSSIPRETSYLDVRKEISGKQGYAIGILKLKYVLNEFKTDSLILKLTQNGENIKLPTSIYEVNEGDNRIDIDFKASPKLKHLKSYVLTITNSNKEVYKVAFKYVNPEFLN